MGRYSPDQELLLINKSMPANFRELLCLCVFFRLTLILSDTHGDVFLLEHIYIFSAIITFYKISVSQTYHESRISPPSWEPLHARGMARTQSPQLSMDGVGRGGKTKQQSNEQFSEICNKGSYRILLLCLLSST